MNQTSLNVSHRGVGLFHAFFPPSFSMGINPNPTHGNPSRNCFVRVHPIFSSESYLVYRGMVIRPFFLTTLSRGQTPADNYTNDYLAWGGNKKNAKIPSVDNYLNDFYNYKKILIKKNHKLFSSVNIYLTYFYNYKKNYKLFVTLRMGVGS